MPYLIDGHNLIGKLPDIDLKDPNDEAKLVQKLMGFVARTGKKCVVVFDHGLPGGSSRMSNGGVRVIFASHKSNADKVMIDRIYKENRPKDWIVVSSDNAVLETARRKQMQVMKSSEFAVILQRPPPPQKPGPDEAVDVKLTEAELEEWLQLFTSAEKPYSAKKP